MPHSISPEDPSTPDQDTMVANAETDKVETQTTDDTVVADGSNGITQEDDAEDQDMTMADADDQEEQMPEAAIKTEIKTEVKLEDLFADMESDDEFPSSNGQDVKVSSSPEAPASPV
jgi:DNA primase small subunit